MLNARLQASKQQRAKSEVEQSKWRDRERFLEAKISDYEMQMNAGHGDSVEKESSGAVAKVSSGETGTRTARSIEPCCEQPGPVPDEIGDLQNIKLSKSKEHHFEEEMGRFSAGENEQPAKTKLVESQVTELREMALEDCPQKKTVDKPYTKEIMTQTEFTMREKASMAQPESWEEEKAKWMNRVNELFEEKTSILAMYVDEREKTARLEKNAEVASQHREELKQTVRNELRYREQQKRKMEGRYHQQLEYLQQREDDLTETKERLEMELREAHEKDKEQSMREVQLKEEMEKLLHQNEFLSATINANKQKECKGFFLRVFGRSN